MTGPDGRSRHGVVVEIGVDVDCVPGLRAGDETRDGDEGARGAGAAVDDGDLGA